MNALPNARFVANRAHLALARRIPLDAESETMSLKRALAVVVCALALGFSLFGAYFARKGYQLCHPSRSHASAEETAHARAVFPKLADVEFETRDGITLRGWFVPPTNGVVVILVHGLYANRASLEPEAEVMVRHGYGVLLYDSRAHGESTGTAATWGSSEALDIADAVQFVKAKPAVARVVLLGFSVGASAVSRATANDASLDPVILYATWPSLQKEIGYKMAAGGWLGAQFALLGMRLSGTRVEQIAPEEDVKRISPRPVLMLSGDRDTDTPPWAMDYLFGLFTQPKELWREHGLGHGGYYEAEPAEYERRVIGFLDRYSGRTP